MVIVKRQAQLLQVILALRSASGFACLLDRWQQQGD
jgi:hypothetical protein